MSYKLEFHPDALREWNKLDETIKGQFKKKLKERLVEPKIPRASVNGCKDLYKIKLTALGYRLVYKVIDSTITVYVLSIGKREENAAYNKGHKRNK